MPTRFRWQPVVGRPHRAIQFTDLSSEAPTAWDWTFYDTDGVTVLGRSTLRNPVFTFDTKGDYPVHLATLAGSGSGGGGGPTAQNAVEFDIRLDGVDHHVVLDQNYGDVAGVTAAISSQTGLSIGATGDALEIFSGSFGSHTISIENYVQHGTTSIGMESPIFTDGTISTEATLVGNNPAGIDYSGGGVIINPPPPPPPPPPTDLTEDPPPGLLAGRALVYDHDFRIASTVEEYGWYRNNWRSNRNNELQNWNPDRVYLDAEGVHLICSYTTDIANNNGSNYRFGMIENALAIGPGLYAFRVKQMPKFDPGLWCGPWLTGSNGGYEIDIAEDPSLDPTHYYSTLHNPNWPSIPVLCDTTTEHIYAVDWATDHITFYMDWAPVGYITDPATVSQMSAARMTVLLQTAVGGNWPRPPDASTIAYLMTDPELVCRWFRYWAPPRISGTIWQVPAQGTLQSVVDGASPGDDIFVDGVVDVDGDALLLVNRRNADGATPISIFGLPGSLLRCQGSGVLGFGSNRGWWLQALNFQIAGGSDAPFGSNPAEFNEGIYFDGRRTDFGGDGLGGSDITILDCTVNPIPGTGHIQRNGINVWGCDVVRVGRSSAASASYNDLGGCEGCAGSGISIGQGKAAPGRPNLPNGARFWIHDNDITGMVGPGTAADDRNGIILDQFLGVPGQPFFTDRIHGLVVIEGNHVSDCEGRAIQLLMAGTDDTPIHVLDNTVAGFIATNLGTSEPIAAIGGYGDGRCGNVLVSGNDCSGITGGAAAFKFISFDAAMDPSIAGVRGSENIGSPVVFEASPTNTPPVGFT